MRSTRRSARNSTAVQASTTEAAVSNLHTTEAASAYATPARAQGPAAVAASNGDSHFAQEEITSAHQSHVESSHVTRSSTRVPASASPAPGKTNTKSATKAKSVASTAASERATSSPQSLGATNTVTPPDSIRPIKAMDSPAVTVKIDSAAANNLSSNDADANTSTVADAIDKQMETETSTATVEKKEEDSERNKASAPDESKTTTAPVEVPGDGNTNNDTNNGGSNKSQRATVSRRGRYISPGRRLQPPVTAPAPAISSPPSRNSISNNNNTESVIEYKTFRSPPRKRDEEVPSLCSTGSGHLTGVSTRSVAEKGVKSAAADPAAPKPPASSISCDPSMIDSTSPLASHEQADERKQPPVGTKNPAGAGSGSQTPPRETADTFKKSPVRSPPGSNFQVLPSLDDAKMLSPGGIFLSQNPATPSYRGLHAGGSFEEKKRDPDNQDYNDNMDAKPSPRRDRDRYVATPTDFALDYGKGHHVSGSFDTSNVLAWLQSPTANGFFSPGGYGSIMNTPHAAGAPRTPRTPTVSTSFFFSDVASLPRGSDNLTPKGESASKRAQKGISNIICISPLASSKARSGTNTNTNTPVNLKDVFASPKEKEKNPRSLPMLNGTPSNPNRSRVPQRSGSKDPSLDAVHMAERDLMEDEDLSVLLQLASNTPRSADRGAGNNTGGGMHVFRSPNGRKDNGGTGGENLPALQLPMIGGRDGDVGAARLPRKSQSREHPEGDDFAPPQLGMRSNLSSGSKEMFVGGNPKPGPKPMKDGAKKSDSDKNDKRGPPIRPPPPPSSNNPYPMPPPYPPHHGHDFYPMPPGMPPGPNGSMRVVVGGPPPPRVGSKPGSPSRHHPGGPHPGGPHPGGPHPGGPHPGAPNGSPHAPPPHYHGDPYSGMPYPPPPHGMYNQYPGPPHMGMGGYPYQSHYPPPPPRHMPMYGAQHPPGAPKGPIKKLKPPKPPKSNSGIKRGGSPLLDAKDSVSSAKKLKKTPTTSSQKKKNKSPQLVDRAERQKAADTIAAVNAASGGKNDRAAALAAAILRGVTMRPSGKWQAQLYFAGKSRYIGVFDTREKAALAYEIAREKLKSGTPDAGTAGLNVKSTENLVNAARKAAFEGVNERAPK